MTAQSGRNFKLLGGFNSYNFFNNPLGAPDMADSGVVLNGITQSQLQANVGVFQGPNRGEPVVFLNPSLFANGAQPILPVTTPGQLGQFIFLRGPKFVNTDLSVLKSIPVHERLRLNFRAEFRNNCVMPGPSPQNITFDIVTYGNGTVVDGITAPTAGGLTVLVYDSGTSSWY